MKTRSGMRPIRPHVGSEGKPVSQALITRALGRTRHLKAVQFKRRPTRRPKHASRPTPNPSPPPPPPLPVRSAFVISDEEDDKDIDVQFISGARFNSQAVATDGYFPPILVLPRRPTASGTLALPVGVVLGTWRETRGWSYRANAVYACLDLDGNVLRRISKFDKQGEVTPGEKYRCLTSTTCRHQDISHSPRFLGLSRTVIDKRVQDLLSAACDTSRLEGEPAEADEIQQ